MKVCLLKLLYGLHYTPYTECYSALAKDGLGDNLKKVFVGL